MLQRVTRKEALDSLQIKVSPSDVKKELTATADELNKKIDSKLTRTMLATLLGRKCQKEDILVSASSAHLLHLQCSPLPRRCRYSTGVGERGR